MNAINFSTTVYLDCTYTEILLSSNRQKWIIRFYPQGLDVQLKGGASIGSQVRLLRRRLKSDTNRSSRTPNGRVNWYFRTSSERRKNFRNRIFAMDSGYECKVGESGYRCELDVFSDLLH